MSYNEYEFCALSNSLKFQQWLYQYSPELYDGLIEHFKTAPSCDKNRQKMLEILNIITSSPVGTKQLNEFLIQHYPTTINQPVLTVVNTDEHGIFNNYDPNLLTFPARIILTGDNIQSTVVDYLATKAIGYYLIIDNYAYIEYLDPQYQHLINKIPDNKWLLKNHKQTKVLQNSNG